MVADDEGDRAAVSFGQPIRSGYVLVKRDHLANVTSLNHERFFDLWGTSVRVCCMGNGFFMRADEGMVSVATGAAKGLSDEQRLILGKFQWVMAAVDRTRLGREGGSLSLSFHWHVDTGAVTETNLPPEDELWALSAAIRPLIAKNDHLQFGGVCRILKRSGYYPAEDAGVERVRAQWNATLEHHFIQIGPHAPRDLIELRPLVDAVLARDAESRRAAPTT